MLTLNEPACVADALRDLAQHSAFESILSSQPTYGVWGKVATPDTQLKDGDRLEFYRKLFADPKTARRRRAQQQSS